MEGLQDVAVPPGKRVAVRLGDHVSREDLPLVVRSNQPVVVERDLYVVGAPGVYAMAAIPAS